MALTLCCVCVFRSLSLSVVLLSQFCIPPDIHARSSTVCTVCLFSPEFFALPPSHGRHLSFQHPPLCCSCALVFSHFASVSLGGGRKEGSAFWSVAALSSFSYFFSLRHPTKYPTHTHTLRLCRLSLLYVRCCAVHTAGQKHAVTKKKKTLLRTKRKFGVASSTVECR